MPATPSAPALAESFKLSPDPQFIDKVRDIVALYLNPPDAAVVLCVDEKSQIQALDRTAAIRTWITDWNENPRPFVWHKTSDEILESLAAYCEGICDSGH